MSKIANKAAKRQRRQLVYRNPATKDYAILDAPADGGRVAGQFTQVGPGAFGMFLYVGMANELLRIIHENLPDLPPPDYAARVGTSVEHLSDMIDGRAPVILDAHTWDVVFRLLDHAWPEHLRRTHERYEAISRRKHAREATASADVERIEVLDAEG